VHGDRDVRCAGGVERDGLVKRIAYATIPPRVDYELTEAGHSLKEPLFALASWARSRQADIQAAQQEFDARTGDNASS
jgi:DNA-binding HxlR family transcriptional regulator